MACRERGQQPQQFMPYRLVEGDRVTLAGVMGMENFPAASLNRTFDRILFVSSYVKQ